jgi:folate-binding protein YgfZ
VPGGFGLAAGTLVEEDGAPRRVQIDADFGLALGAAGDDADPADLERRRVLAARPRHGHEIVEAFDPFEVGLAHEIHLSKGCFTGQEALMRMVTYRGLRRRLARVAGRGAAPGTPADLQCQDRRAGVLTSAIAEDGGWIGLAVIDGRIASETMTLAADGSTLSRWEFVPETRPLGLP